MTRFSGQVALVTGGATGIGLAVSSRLAREGAHVGIVDLDDQALARAAATVSKYGGKVHTAVADVGNAEDVEASVQAISDHLGPIDILVNNAGTWVIKPYINADDDDFTRQVSTNLTGPHLYMTRVLPQMIRRGSGCIINISSVAALHYTSPHAVYAATKAGVVALTRDVAYEVARHGVRVNGVAPGLIATDKVIAQLGESEDSLRRSTDFRPMGWGAPDDLAGVVAFLASDDARFVVGVTIPVAGGSDLLVTMAADAVPAVFGAYPPERNDSPDVLSEIR